MMHLLRKYDVARFTRNDAMFAIKCGEATHHKAKPSSLVKRHHLPKANIIEKSTSEEVLFSGWDGWARTSEMPESKSGALPLGYTPI